MNKPKFQNLCERILIPKFDKVVRKHLESLERQTAAIAEMLDMTAGALARLEGKIDGLSPSLEATEEPDVTIR
jgi:predicted nuclease with TOPRIM domain